MVTPLPTTPDPHETSTINMCWVAVPMAGALPRRTENLLLDALAASDPERTALERTHDRR